MLHKRIFAACVFSAVCLSAFLAAPAEALAVSTTVRIDDVDANTNAGAARLLRRIERAAQRVCGVEIARRYIGTRRTYRRCVEMTMVNTIELIGSERLYSEYVTQYGHP